MNSGDESEDLRRMRWRSRRGMLELDLYLVPFADHQYSGLTLADRAAYGELLECEDWEILDWLRRESAPAPDLAHIVTLVRDARAQD